jgi:hypothetical protein
VGTIVSYHIDEVIEKDTGRTLYMFGAGDYRSLLARYTREAAIEDGEEYLAKTGRAHLIENESFRSKVSP